MLSRREQSIFRPLVEEAWRAYCVRNEQDRRDRAARNKWYRKELLSSDLGINSTKQVRTPKELDTILLHFAVIAGNEHWLDRLAAGDERRALFVLQQTVERVGVDRNYVRGIARQMGYGDRRIEELPATTILKINAAMSKHEERKRRHE